MQEDPLVTITRRLSNLETHIINLILPIQNIAKCLTSSTDIEYLIKALQGPIPINDSSLRSLLKSFESEMRSFDKNLEKMNSMMKENSVGEIKYIGNRLNEIEKLLKKVLEDQQTKKINLEFSCDGYDLVKKPVGYDPKEPVEPNKIEEIDKLLNTLPPREAQAIIHRLGLFKQKAQTFVGLGKIFGVTRERARQIFSKAIRKCRDPKRIEIVRKINDKKLRNEILGVN